MADAAASITIGFTAVFGSNFTRLMCYCHVERACVRRLNGNEDKDTIILDLIFNWLYSLTFLLFFFFSHPSNKVFLKLLIN